jgi:hypothetical protein
MMFLGVITPAPSLFCVRGVATPLSRHSKAGLMLRYNAVALFYLALPKRQRCFWVFGCSLTVIIYFILNVLEGLEGHGYIRE